MPSNGGNMKSKIMEKTKCIKCGILIDYEPKMCCNGSDCGCMGLPIEPPVCDKCFDDLYSIKVEQIDRCE